MSTLRRLFLAVALLAAAPVHAADTVSGMIGSPTRHVVTGVETFVDLMARYGVGYTELVAANPGIDPWIPKPGTILAIPTAHLLPAVPHRGIVVNLGDHRLYWFAGDGNPPRSFPIGIGREGWATPLGETVIARKRKDPAWTVPASIRAKNPDLPTVVAAGPNNPLGAFALDLGWNNYVIHGTNKPGGIGRRVSHGCIRLANADAGALFAAAPVGTPVTIVDQPAKLGWNDGALWIEVHPDHSQTTELEETGRFTPASEPGIGTRILDAIAGKNLQIDWPAVTRAVAERRGEPVRIATAKPQSAPKR